jgi:hypothetical protein
MAISISEHEAAFIDLEDDAELQARLVFRALKTPFQGRVTYRQGDYIEGAALARNLGRGDIALKLNRYVAPGAPIELELDCLTYRGLPIRMRAEVEACEQDETGKSFVAFAHVSRSAIASQS